MLRISFINVGYGESILVEERRGGASFNILIDAGKPDRGPGRGEYSGHPDRITAAAYLASRGIGRIDLLILSHPHIDHAGGLPELLRSTQVGEMWTNYAVRADPREIPAALPGARPEANEVLEALACCAEAGAILGRQGKRPKEIRSDEAGIALSPDLGMDIYGIGDGLYRRMDDSVSAILEGDAVGKEGRLAELDSMLNASCLTFRLSYAGRHALFGADVPCGHWDRILDSGSSIRSDILKFPHHGHEDGASERFIEAVAPSRVVFCVSEDNPFGCPKPAALGFLRRGELLYATGNLALVPGTAAPPPHRAVVFQISEDSRIEAWLEYP
jgi:competence protein ComEC